MKVQPLPYPAFATSQAAAIDAPSVTEAPSPGTPLQLVASATTRCGLARRQVYALLGMPIDAVDMEATLARIEHAVATRERLFISTPNSNFTVAVQSDPAFRRSVQLSDLVVPDGMPLVFVARLLGRDVKGRVTGADLFEELLQKATHPVRVYFFGGPEGAAQSASDRINAMNSQVRCVGFASPGFVPVEELSDDATLDHINECKPDFVVVALGAKKGQAWIMRNLHRIDAPVISHLGAVVNFTAGSVKRAPQWVQTIGAEWLWRIYQEPVLWRRYWNDGRGMLRMFFLQVLPECIDAWSHRLGDGPPSHGLSTRTGAVEAWITLTGDWRSVPLDAVAMSLQAAIDMHQPVQVDANRLERVDARLIGLLLLAEVRVPSLAVHGASASLRRQFERQSAGFLLAEP